MIQYLQKFLIIHLLLLISSLISCDQPVEPLSTDEEEEEETLFQPGEYGGDPLEDTEHLYNFLMSPDGSKIAFIRSRTPGEIFHPRNQLWIVNADGTDPQLFGFNIMRVSWSPDSQKIATTYHMQFGVTYVLTFDVNDKDNVQIWTGLEGQKLDKRTAANPQWFSDGKRLLLTVWAIAYQQEYDGGLYVLNTHDQSVEGPLVTDATSGMLGSYNDYIIAKKHTAIGDSLNENTIRFDLKLENWEWITQFDPDSLSRWIKHPVPNPVGNELIYPRHIDHAWQLFKMNEQGEQIEQITEFGGENPNWSPDGRYVFFNRDVHKADGARYVPHYYEPESGHIGVLWPDLPDSIPQLPPLETQNPIDFHSIVQEHISS